MLHSCFRKTNYWNTSETEVTNTLHMNVLWTLNGNTGSRCIRISRASISAFLFSLIGGDAGTTNKCAEVHGLHKTFLIYSNDFTGHEDYNTDRHMTVEVKRKVISDHMTIYISHERVEVTNYRGYQAVYDSRYLFQLSGQLIGRPPSTATDVWLSMNRVISGTYRSGTGLCKVAISWV